MSIYSATLPVLDRNLALEVVRVTESSALAAARQTGRGDERAADQAACSAMQHALNGLAMEGVIVNGEGDDPSQPLHTGEKVGNGKGPKVDIVLTALEGRSICARGAHNALSVVAMTEEGSFLKVPQHSYMEKIVVGAGLPAGLLDLDSTPEENLSRLAEAKGLTISELTVSVLDRPRHAELIERLYAAGVRVTLFDDGDVSGALAAGLPGSGVDVYMGSGGAAQGVLAAAGLKCLGAQMQCRLLCRSEADHAAARRVGIGDTRRKWNIDDMVRGEVMFAATGITDGHVLKGARLFPGNRAESHSLVMRSATGTIRHLSVQHDLSRSHLPA
ncbi:fructose 1,6-bisphosphatase II(Fructose-1,6-bisphosphatase class 2/Sedoheputulose-1,7-bisphosphatase,12-321) [Magnetospirillum sp. XM-1]|uniref:class II fructose-bisphosphatase n=1 Tax=Magnetospirillum sp. XM-1 TaxID=1663591 RepID=UPI00073DDFB5|nr:class II fructose-bisphosphatase [Magnetospirillum sp. XM-1]CUW38664.1 fructose 1,6-bisphosphatase II(Fructose-1,6-bisphosphatase class 2/Sedoheputulose-1,7-bisphosphatase,12-321) [Magnetospirillum sp. XM-1]